MTKFVQTTLDDGSLSITESAGKRLGGQLGYSMYSVIQALTEHKILVDLPPDVRVVVEDWAARYCFNLSDQYNPEATPVERIEPEHVKEILDSLRY